MRGVIVRGFSADEVGTCASRWRAAGDATAVMGVNGGGRGRGRRCWALLPTPLCFGGVAQLAGAPAELTAWKKVVDSHDPVAKDAVSRWYQVGDCCSVLGVCRVAW